MRKKYHPESREGEMFLCNVRDPDPEEYVKGWGYKTLRLGEIAYDVHGNVVENAYPVFIQKEEL